MALTQVSTDGVKNDAISHNKIPANAIQASELADNAVDTAAIAADAVTGAKIADDAIDSEHYTDGSIDTAHIANSAVSNNKLQDNSIVSGKLADSGVNSGSYGSATAIPAITVNNKGQITAASTNNVNIPAGTTINNNGSNRIITGSGTANTLEGESGLTFSSNTLSINTNGSSIAENNVRFQSSGKAYIDHATTGQDIDIRTSVSSSLDTTGITIKSTGNLAFASGHGIDFGATANGGTGTPNELFDDYEEGSWTPALEGLSNTPSFHNLGGNYTKIGNRVFLQGHIQINVRPQFSNQSATFKISGLPFTGTSATGSGYFGCHGVCLWQQMQWVGSSYSSYGASNDTQLSPGIVDSGTRITFQTCGQDIYYVGQMLNRAVHDNYSWNLEWDMWYRTA